MGRRARVVIPGVVHHVVQRGNRRQNTFFKEDHYRMYISLLSKYCQRHGVSIWAYCIMQNHVHLVAVPEMKESLAKGIGGSHKMYTRYINSENEWKGYLWQGRFSSFPMDRAHLMNAVKYIELNPVRAGIVKDPFKYPWSSARAHLEQKNDPLVDVEPMLKKVHNWEKYLAEGLERDQLKKLRENERSGLPMGDERFIADLEEELGIDLRRRKPGKQPFQLSSNK